MQLNYVLKKFIFINLFKSEVVNLTNVYNIDYLYFSGYICHVNQKEQERLYQLLGENVRRYRIQRGFTQEQLADRIDLTRTSVVNIEQGRQHPPLHLLFQIAKSLKVPLQTLVPEESAFVVDTVLDDNTLKDVPDKDKLKLTAFLTDHITMPTSHD